MVQAMNAIRNYETGLSTQILTSLQNLSGLTI